MGLGALGVVGGLIVAGLTLKVGAPDAVTLAVNLGLGLGLVLGGAASAYLGYRLRDSDTAQPAHFTVLIRLYAVALVMMAAGDVERLVRGEGVTGILAYPLVGWALVTFTRGRQALRDARRERAEVLDAHEPLG